MTYSLEVGHMHSCSSRMWHPCFPNQRSSSFAPPCASMLSLPLEIYTVFVRQRRAGLPQRPVQAAGVGRRRQRQHCLLCGHGRQHERLHRHHERRVFYMHFSSLFRTSRPPALDTVSRVIFCFVLLFLRCDQCCERDISLLNNGFDSPIQRHTVVEVQIIKIHCRNI